MEGKVKIYTTAACPNCQQAKEFLSARGVPFDAVDVSKDQGALQEMRKISGGARTVPVIAVCGKILVGFDRAALEGALKCLD